MPTITKTKKTETRANAPDAAELFKRGQRLLAGEDPTKVFPKEKTAAAPKPELIGVPAMLADLVGDMIVKGSTPRSLNALVYAVLDHQWRNFSFTAHEGTEKLAKDARDWAESNAPEWLDALAAVRHARRGEGDNDEPEDQAGTISERIRRTAKDALRGQLKAFICNATPEDTLLMTAILQDWDSHSLCRPEEPAHESALAIGFQYALGSNHTYIRVPDRLADHIASYANALVNATGVPEVQANA